MKALILSDIHANVVALEAIWQRERDSDIIYCAGDLVDYGPYPREVIAWVRAHNVTCVRGNHDEYVAHCFRSGQLPENIPADERAWAHHNASLLTEEEVAFLEQLPVAAAFDFCGDRYGLTHLYREYDELVSLHAFDNFAAQIFDEDGPPLPTRLIFGHTHRQAIRSLSDSHLWLNPGSVSYRRRDDPDQTAHYATITNGEIALKRLAYDVSTLHRYAQAPDLKRSIGEPEINWALWAFGARELPNRNG